MLGVEMENWTEFHSKEVKIFKMKRYEVVKDKNLSILGHEFTSFGNTDSNSPVIYHKEKKYYWPNKSWRKRKAEIVKVTLQRCSSGIVDLPNGFRLAINVSEISEGYVLGIVIWSYELLICMKMSQNKIKLQVWFRVKATVWKSQDFSGTQILREIKIREFRSSKTGAFAILVSVNFVNLVISV